MNKDNKQLLWIIGIIVLAVVGYGYFSNNEIKPFAVGDLQLPYIESPVFGFVECLDTGQFFSTGQVPAEQSKTSFFSDNLNWYVIKCSQYGETDECQVTISTPREDLSSLNKGISIGVCNDGTSLASCPVNEQTFGVGSEDAHSYQNPLYRNQFLVFNYQTILGFGNKNRIGSTFKVDMNIWSLYKTDLFHGGKQKILSTTNCAVPEDVRKQAVQTSSLVSINYVNNVPPTYVQIGQPFNYISDFVPKAVFSRGTDKAGLYCFNKGLYKIEQITVNNFKYNIVNSNFNQRVETVACCNNEAQPGVVCQNNQWVSVATQQCDLTKPCSGGTQYNLDTSDPTQKTAIIYNCIENKCVPTKKQVACVTDIACGQGQICEFNYIEPEKSKCITPSGGILPSKPTSLPKSVCKSCFGWLWNFLVGNTYCTPEPAKKIFFGLVSIPLTSQKSICYLFLLIVFALLGLGILFGISLYKKRRKHR
ncbi:MAG: hypothetical protein AABY22_11845 [Nanoarchaeota archaeon]